MTPRIGLTASRARKTDGTPHESVVPYVRAIERYGAQAVLLPNDPANLDEMLAGIDALVLSGGVDVDPQCYGGNTEHSRSERGEYRADRDAFEIELARRVREHGVPTLAICRGLQVVNVAFGGTLVEDLVDEFGPTSAIDHRQTDAQGVERYDYAPGHTVSLSSDSALARLVGSRSFETNSMHHQAVRVVGNGLVIGAQTSDGVVEALDATFPHPYFFAVQWHPEELDDAISRSLFAGLVAAAAKSVSAPVRSGE